MTTAKESANPNSVPEAAYIHIPFCLSKCKYCDFTSYPGLDAYMEDYALALLSQIASYPSGAPLSSIYFGGGTPSCMDADSLAQILDALKDKYTLSEDCEVTFEANPETVNVDNVPVLRGAGFNRVSLGVQSFNDKLLRTLGRVHDSAQVFSALQIIKKSNFDSISIDLMYGLPGQTLENWRQDLQTAIDLDVQHISAYELSVEKGTPLEAEVSSGALAMPDEELQIDMMLLAQQVLSNAAYRRYEVSNYAHPGFECRHNLVYWHNGPYYGFGAGATGCHLNRRYTNVEDPVSFIRLINSGQDVIGTCEIIDRPIWEAETLMMGLRLADGIDEAIISSMSEQTRQKVSRMICEGMLSSADGKTSATQKGYMLLNDLLAQFLP